MANPTISISGFTLLPERLQAGSPFTATITIKNNLGAAALYAYLTAHIDMEDLDAGDSGAGRVNLYSSGVQQVSIPNGASKALTFSGIIRDSVWDDLNAIWEKYPSAPIRRNAIIWTLHMDNGGFEYSADEIAHAGELLDAFYSPAIEAFRLERCMNGVPNDEGENLLSTIKLGLAEKARQDFLSLKLYYSDSSPATADSDYIDLSSSIPDLIAGITDSADLISQAFGNTANWHFLLVFGDAYESAAAAFSLSRAFANLHLSGATTGGAAFGGFSTSQEGSPKLESHYPIHAYAGIEGYGAYIGAKDALSYSLANNAYLYTPNITIPRDGLYLIIAYGNFQGAANTTGGWRMVFIQKNGADVAITHLPHTQSGWPTYYLPEIFELKAGDTIRSGVQQTSGTARQCSAGFKIVQLSNAITA